MTVGASEGVTGPYGTLPPGTPGATGTTGTSGIPGSTSTSTASDDKDMFLQLLVAQMKYQDPMNPTDSAEFLAQSAQFTSLEKMQAVADQTALLLGSQLAFGASSLVGRTVSYTLADGTAGTGPVRGVEFGPSGPVLDVDGVSVPIANVMSVSDGSGVGTPGGTPGGTTSAPTAPPEDAADGPSDPGSL